MPLTEEQRGILVDDLKALDFAYEGYDFEAEVYRSGEGFSIIHPNVLVDFLPVNRKKFQSLSDVVGIASGRYYQYGVCHIELASVAVYCNEYHETEDGNTSLSGRLLSDSIANKCLMRVLKGWEDLLYPFGASFDRKSTVPVIRNLTTYNRETATKIYALDFDILLRTQLRWDKVPDDYVEDEDVAEKAVVHIDPQGNTDYRKTIIINTS